MDSTQKLALALCVLTAIIWWFILIPITIYNGYNYYKLRDHIILQKRYSSITINEVIIMISKLIWGIFLFFMVAYFGEGSLYATLFEIPYQLLSFMLLYCWVWRFFCIHYDINFTLSTVKIDWAIIINRRFKDLKTNWYISHKKNFGNSVWFRNHIIIPLVLIQTFIIIAPIIYFSILYKNDNQSSDYDNVWHQLQLFGSANLLIPFILLLVIYLRTPRFNDNLLISQELKKIFIILLIKNILTFTIFLYQIIKNPSTKIDIICFFFFLNISNGGQWIAILIATYFVNKEVSPIIKKHQYKIMDYHTISNQRRNSASIPYLRITSSNRGDHDNDNDGGSPQSTNSMRIKHRNNTNHDDEIKLLHVIQQYEGFEAFIAHLSYEFCMENLLSFVEILQYQQFISLCMKQKSLNIDVKDKMDKMDKIGPINTSSDYNKALYERIKLPKQLPKSSIVYDGMDEFLTQNIAETEFINMMKIKAYKLYKKYIAVGIQYQVNISYSTRRRIEKIVKNYDTFLLNECITLNDLLFLFEKVSEEIYSLMMDSFNRFSSTAEFEKIQQLILSSN